MALRFEHQAHDLGRHAAGQVDGLQVLENLPVDVLVGVRLDLDEDEVGVRLNGEPHLDQAVGQAAGGDRFRRQRVPPGEPGDAREAEDRVPVAVDEPLGGAVVPLVHPSPSVRWPLWKVHPRSGDGKGEGEDALAPTGGR